MATDANERDPRGRAIDCLRAGVAYKANPVVRVQAVEALAAYPNEEMKPWLRTALLDEHPAVRFAGCVAVGTLKDRVAEAKVRDLARDDDANVRLAALFALHELGFRERTGELSNYLLNFDDPAVRRNAALLLGMLGEESAAKVLARAMRDSDVGVRHHALEAMARLGQKEAKQELAFLSNSGVGVEEAFAVGALAASEDPAHVDALRFKLGNAVHVETKLAAAKGLGLHGSDEGFELAMNSFRSPPSPVDDPNDPPADQALRVRQMAAGALETIGRRDALPLLVDAMSEERDPRVQVAAAKAVLGILDGRAPNRRAAAGKR